MSTRKQQQQKVADVVRGRITSGEYQPGRRMPSQSELAEEFGVSGRTVCLAVADLRELGYLWTLPHKGSYARPPEHWPESIPTLDRTP